VASQQLPLVIVAGPTGSGKSALALELARQFGGEIVNCDSLQLYRGFDIGTAKTPFAERRGIPITCSTCWRCKKVTPQVNTPGPPVPFCAKFPRADGSRS